MLDRKENPVLIVDESQDTRETLGRLLKFEQEIEVIAMSCQNRK
ncbi:MAG TPA: hypothetical protein VFC84_17285 [Desulfosporosinus sp.]|nr:hypothetical protein [Desulfosporosinus sp.]